MRHYPRAHDTRHVHSHKHTYTLVCKDASWKNTHAPVQHQYFVFSNLPGKCHDVLDTFMLWIHLLIIEINNSQGDHIDVSAKKASLYITANNATQHLKWRWIRCQGVLRINPSNLSFSTHKCLKGSQLCPADDHKKAYHSGTCLSSKESYG